MTFASPGPWPAEVPLHGALVYITYPPSRQKIPFIDITDDMLEFSSVEKDRYIYSGHYSKADF